MSCSQRMIWFASQCAISLLVLAGCSPWTPTRPEDRAGHPAAAPAEPACTNWNAYDEGWHRRHCNVAIRWCDSSGAAGAGATGTNGSGGTTGSTNGTGGGTGSAGIAGAAGTGAGGNGAGAGAPKDAGSAEGDASASVDSGVAPDGGHAATDAGQTNAGSGTCTVSATCQQGMSCVAGSCQPCAGAVCACQRDDDCSSTQVCDHDTGACSTPPPTCAALTTEAACSARVDCTPIYGGMSCTNAVGTPCHSGEANCTCATYSFAACVAHD